MSRKVDLAFIEDQFREKCLFILESYRAEVITWSAGLLQKD